jgi:hypothetical protein
MDPALFPELARHIDRTRRFILANRAGITIHDAPRGWMSLELGEPCEEIPSNNPNRLGWFASENLTADDVRSAFAAVRALGRNRIFVWIGPAGWTPSLHEELERNGAHLWPYVKYPVLARAIGECPDTRPTNFEVRIVGRSEAGPILESAALWYSKKGIQSALKLVQEGHVELHAAFDGQTIAALATLYMDGPWGYLGWAGTDPERRKRGGQTSLIRSRMQSAARHGAKWLVAETVTVDMTSTTNLIRCGFEVAFGWKVYRWDDPAPPAT